MKMRSSLSLLQGDLFQPPPSRPLWRNLPPDLQAAQYAARRAQKQFDAADPENRLVAEELERRWNEALQRVRDVEARFD